MISNSDNQTALHFAIKSERMEIIHYMLFGMSEIVALDSITPEMLLTQMKICPWISRSLIAIDVVSIAEGYTPFHLACCGGKVSLIKLLVKVSQI